MGKKGPLWWRESDWLLRGSSAANQILLHHSGPILSDATDKSFNVFNNVANISHTSKVPNPFQKSYITEFAMN